MGAGEHKRFSLRHLYQNFKKIFGGGTLLRDLMMGATKTTHVVGFPLQLLFFGPLFLYTNMFKENPVCRKAH